MKTQKSPDCQHLQFSTHCQFSANNSAKVAWRKMPEKTQYICSILHDHAMTIRWKFTILHQKMRFLTSENMICGTRWLCFKTDEKKWSVQHDAEKDVATVEKNANYLGASCFFTCWHSNTADGIGELQSPRVYIYIYIYIYICSIFYVVRMFYWSYIVYIYIIIWDLLFIAYNIYIYI